MISFNADLTESNDPQNTTPRYVRNLKFVVSKTKRILQKKPPTQFTPKSLVDVKLTPYSIKVIVPLHSHVLIKKYASELLHECVKKYRVGIVV